MSETNLQDEIVVVAEVTASAVEMSVSYPPYSIALPGFDQPFRDKLIGQYKLKADHETRDCILLINATVAGSRVVRGIFELYKAVQARGGQLVCGAYPSDYVRSLTDLGIPSLPGFSLCASVEDARTRIRALRGAK